MPTQFRYISFLIWFSYLVLLYGDKSNEQAPNNQSKSEYSVQTDTGYHHQKAQSGLDSQTALPQACNDNLLKLIN